MVFEPRLPSCPTPVSERWLSFRYVQGADDVIYQAADRDLNTYSAGGTLEAWKAEVAALAVGNPLLIGGLSAAFAGPLMKRCHAAIGGIHLVGDSSRGKSGIIDTACSVWGHPDEFRKSWSSTANGMEGIAARHNDCLLPLDELGQCAGKDVGGIIYALGNGVGKQRASRTGAARPVVRWRVFVLSSGELTPAGQMEKYGLRAMAGQEVRLLNVSSDRTYGVWDNLHHLPSGAALTDTLKTAAGNCCGHAGIAFLEKLSRDNRNFCEMLDEFKALPELRLPNADGQEVRAAAQFALVAMAGELATEYGITGWPEGAATVAIADLLLSWADRRGRGATEERQILEQLQGFIDRFGDSRFSDIEEHEGVLQRTVNDRAGWWRDTSDGRLYLFTPAGMKEALKGFDFRRALLAIQGAGVMATVGADGKTAKKVRIGKTTARLYHIDPEALNCQAVVNHEGTSGTSGTGSNDATLRRSTAKLQCSGVR